MPGLVQGADRAPGRGEQVVGELVVGELGQRPADGRRRHQQGHVGAADAGAFHAGCGDAGAFGAHQGIGDVLDLLHAGAEDRQARLLEHRPAPELGADPCVALVAAEGVDPKGLPVDRRRVEHRRSHVLLGRVVERADLVAEVADRGPRLGERGTPGGRAEHQADHRDDRDGEEQSADDIGGVRGAQVHGRQHDHQHDGCGQAAQWPGDVGSEGEGQRERDGARSGWEHRAVADADVDRDALDRLGPEDRVEQQRDPPG